MIQGRCWSPRRAASSTSRSAASSPSPAPASSCAAAARPPARPPARMPRCGESRFEPLSLASSSQRLRIRLGNPPGNSRGRTASSKGARGALEACEASGAGQVRVFTVAVARTRPPQRPVSTSPRPALSAPRRHFRGPARPGRPGRVSSSPESRPGRPVGRRGRRRKSRRKSQPGRPAGPGRRPLGPDARGRSGRGDPARFWSL